MTVGTWKTVGIVDNNDMMVPHVLQQKYIHNEASDEHRLVSINELQGVE